MSTCKRSFIEAVPRKIRHIFNLSDSFIVKAHMQTVDCLALY